MIIVVNSILMNLVFHISEDGSEIVYLSDLYILVQHYHMYMKSEVLFFLSKPVIH